MNVIDGSVMQIAIGSGLCCASAIATSTTFITLLHVQPQQLHEEEEWRGYCIISNHRVRTMR